jgi:hypothetical protein
VVQTCHNDTTRLKLKLTKAHSPRLQTALQTKLKSRPGSISLPLDETEPLAAAKEQSQEMPTMLRAVPQVTPEGKSHHVNYLKAQSVILYILTSEGGSPRKWPGVCVWRSIPRPQLDTPNSHIFSIRACPGRVKNGGGCGGGEIDDGAPTGHKARRRRHAQDAETGRETALGRGSPQVPSKCYFVSISAIDDDLRWIYYS